MQCVVSDRGRRLSFLQSLSQTSFKNAARRVRLIVLALSRSRHFQRWLDRATRGIAADVLDPNGATLLELYLIVHAIEGLPSGTYYYRRQEGSVEFASGRKLPRDRGSARPRPGTSSSSLGEYLLSVLAS